jgi:hypothetical protein
VNIESNEQGRASENVSVDADICDTPMSDCQSVGIGMRIKRRLTKPAYLNDYCVRRVMCSFAVQDSPTATTTEPIEMETLSRSATVECGCGAKFTARKSWYRHVRNTCPNRYGDAAVSATPAKKPPTADRPEVVDGHGACWRVVGGSHLSKRDRSGGMVAVDHR